MKSIRKKEGFDGQRAIIIPKKILSQQCTHNAVIKDAYITHIGYYPKAAFHYRKRLTGIDQNILIYCVEGSGRVQIDDTAYAITAGDFFVIPASASHSYAANEEHAWTIYWLHMKGKSSNAMIASIVQNRNSHKGNVTYTEKRIALFEEIYSNLERGYSHENVLYANMCLWQFIASFQFDTKFSDTQFSNTHEVTSLAIEFMQQHMNTSLTLSAIALSANLSVSHFAAVFQKKTGFAPIEYFNHLKMQKACQYLQFTEDRIKEISFHLGIEDAYYFSRLFKKLIGISPVEYRKRFRK